MAPTQETSSTEVDDKAQNMLKEAMKCINGSLDFEKLAAKMGVVNADAMRKRFKRFFEKDDDPIQVKGNHIGATEEGAVVPRTPKTPRVKAAKPALEVDTAAANEAATKPPAKKRDFEDISGDDKSLEYGDAATSEDGAKNEAPKTPAKKPRATKTPAAAKTPKSPGKPRAPRTPKSAAAKKAVKSTKKGDEAGGDKDEAKDVVVGSPAIRAKIDAVIKAAEEESGTVMGESARQAKHDAVEAEMRGDTST